jgi:anaerobic magnesium-protoporphyrin IX monomethyl ester cyclase
MIDVLFINPGNPKKIYQDLSKRFSAIEPPTWSLLLAESCRSKKFKVDILDCNALNFSEKDSLRYIKEKKPKLIVFVVYGQNVNAGTTNMSGAIDLVNYLKKHITTKIAFIGSHVQALPLETLKNEKNIDFVFTNEGVYALLNILTQSDLSENVLKDIKGIAFRDKKDNVHINPAERIVPQEKLEDDLPGYAWDLLPYEKKPLDLYRSPMWHANYEEEKRSPYAAIQTSIGCQFKCEFCMINLINRNDDSEIGVASNYSGMRYWRPEFIIKEFDKLISLGVKTIRITDEMFLLNQKYYKPLCQMLSDRNINDDLQLWAYSRVDTVRRPEILKLVRNAGIKWLCLGIESGDKNIRLEISKGKFEDVDVQKVVEQIHSSGINVMANYIYGLPGDTKETIEKTFNLSLKMCTLGWNTYAAMALPGSSLYKKALENNIELPKTYSGYSFHSYDTVPLPTKHLKNYEVLKMRDEAFIKYHTDKKYLKKIEENFGIKAMENIQEMTKIKLKRKIIENSRDK